MSCYLAELDFPPFGRRKRADQQDGPRARGAFSRGRLRCATRRMWCALTGDDVPMPRSRRSSGTAWHIKRTGKSRGRSWTAQRTPAGSPGRRVPGGQGVRRRVSLRPLTVYTASSVPLVCHLRVELRTARPAVYEFTSVGPVMYVSVQRRLISDSAILRRSVLSEWDRYCWRSSWRNDWPA
jgi:hypothetical protein